MSSDTQPFLVLVTALAEEIADSAIWCEDRCTWMGTLLPPELPASTSQRIEAALGPELYDGTSGVALFLAEAAVRLEDDRLRATALGSLRHALRHAHRVAPDVRDGLYTGQIGIAYAAARVARQINAEFALDGAREVLMAWRRSRARAAAPDVFEGCAGAVTGLVALTELIDEPWLLEAAVDLGDFLIDSTSASTAGWSWSVPGDGADHDLCGFSHGTAGIGHALLELFGVTREVRFREASERAFDYERSWFERRSGTWPDLRGIARATGWDPPAPAAGSWCHGAPGIALSRLRAEQLVSGVAARRDADAGVAIARELASHLLSHTTDDFSLCHGAAGVADVLLYAAEARRQGSRDLARLAAEVGLRGIERHHRPGADFPCGLPHGRTPGLFLGLAGIGLFYLRLHDQSVATPLIIHRRGALTPAEQPP